MMKSEISPSPRNLYIEYFKVFYILNENIRNYFFSFVN